MESFSAPYHRMMFSQMKLEVMINSDKYFNCFPIHSIQLFVPGSEEMISTCSEKLLSPDNVYFNVKEINPSAFIQPTFIKHFVKTGLLSAFSHTAKASIENFLTIIPNGKLILSVEREIALSLSLNKEQQKKQKKKARFGNQTYVLDLTLPGFVPGKKLYDSVLFELNKLNHIKLDVLLKWEPEGNVCPQSLCSYFENLGYECCTFSPNYTHFPKFAVKVPKLNFEQFDLSVAEDVLEWVGTQVCGIEISGETDSFISNFTVPEPSETLHRLQISTYEGFYSGSQICTLLKDIRNMFENNENLPFVIVSIGGYQDCYISSGLGRFSSADKLICLVIHPQLDSYMITLNIN